jgi:hypothetical protein
MNAQDIQHRCECGRVRFLPPETVILATTPVGVPGFNRFTCAHGRDVVLEGLPPKGLSWRVIVIHASRAPE